MGHDPYAQAKGQAPSFLTPGEGGGYLWIYQGLGAPLTGVPIGIFSGTPPPELADVEAIPVGEGKAQEAGLWITRKIHELNRVADRIRVPPPP